MHMEVKARAENVFTQKSVGLCLLDGRVQALQGELVLTADIDIAFISANSITGNEHGFDDAVRVTFQDYAVLEGAGLAFIRVADDILFCSSSFANKTPFQAGRKTCAAASLQP